MAITLLLTMLTLRLLNSMAFSESGSRRMLRCWASRQVLTQQTHELDDYYLPKLSSERWHITAESWHVAITIMCKGKYSSDIDAKLRDALHALLLLQDPTRFSLGGNAATKDWRLLTTFIVRIAGESSFDDALAVTSGVSVKALNRLAKLPKSNAVTKVLLAPFQV